MSEPLRTTCPHCRATFRITNESLVGTSIDCPRCVKSFVVTVRSEVAATPVATTSAAVEGTDSPVAADWGLRERPAPSRLRRVIWWVGVIAVCLAAGLLAAVATARRRAAREETPVEPTTTQELPLPPAHATQPSPLDPLAAPDPATTAASDPVWCLHNLIPLQIAINKYRDAVGQYPTTSIRDANGKPLLSWRVALLPYFESDAAHELYREFHLDEPWDSPHNRKLLERMPKAYRCPHSRAAAGRATYLAAIGERSVLSPTETGVRDEDVTDAPQRTLMIVETTDAASVPWTKPEDLSYRSETFREALGASHRGGFHALVADGFPEFVPKTLDSATLRALCTRDGGEDADFRPRPPAPRTPERQ